MSDIKTGIFYRRKDGVEVEFPEPELWVVGLEVGGGVCMRRFVNGLPDEAYRPMDDAEGAIAAASVILGFEPPRRPIRRERLAP